MAVAAALLRCFWILERGFRRTYSRRLWPIRTNLITASKPFDCYDLVRLGEKWFGEGASGKTDKCFIMFGKGSFLVGILMFGDVFCRVLRVFDNVPISVH